MAPGFDGGDDDFNAMFDVLDLSSRGYLTAEDIQNFFQSLFYKPVNDALVKSVLRDHGGSNDGSTCTKKNFEHVLIKLEEGRKLEESLYWDFVALDENGNRKISVKNCLLLARSSQLSLSLDSWQHWINSRAESYADVSWVEFRGYLYSSSDYGDKKTISEDALNQELETICENEQLLAAMNYESMKRTLETDKEVAAEMKHRQEEYHGQVKQESNRLINRWNYGGVEAVIYDDGTEMERPTVTTEMKNTVSFADVLSALDVKYSMLRHMVLSEMAKQRAEFESPGIAVSGQVFEKHLHEMKKTEKSMRRLKKLDQMLTLPSAELQHSFTCLGVMGETADAYLEKWENAEQRFNALRAQGKLAHEINFIYEREILNEMNGVTTSGEILIRLAKREDEEKEYMMKLLKKTPSDALGIERMRLYSALHLQCIRIEQYGNFEYATISGCLPERKQNEDFDKYAPDQTRQEKLSAIRLEEGRNNNLGKTIPVVVKPDVSHSKNLGLVDSWLEITRLLSQKHSAEREVMTHFLLSNKLEADLIGIKNESQNELHNMRKSLVKQKEAWKETLFQKSTPSEKAQQRSRHHEILSTAIALYVENVRRSKNLSVDNVARIVLARVQVLQDVESGKIFEQMKPMNNTEIYDLRKELYRITRDEHFENITELVLGSVKMTAEEKDLVNLILSKYDELRLKLFKEYLDEKKQGGEQRINFLEKLVTNEEKLRLAGNHRSLAKLCKETFGISYSLQEAMGPDTSRFSEDVTEYLEQLKNSGRRWKIINESPDLGNDPDLTKARGNLLSEIHLRYEDEVNVVLERLQNANPAEKSFLIAAEAAWQQWEILRSNLDSEFLKAALAMGLCERVKTGYGKIKLRQDSLRYVRLAQERLMKSTTLDTKSLQAVSSMSNPVQSSLRRVLLCHAADWKKLYEFLSDESAEELREAAASMSEDERISRLAEINVKRTEIDMKSQDWEGDIVSLLEEAAALKYTTRMNNMKKMLVDSSDVEISAVDICTSIMADLQEEHDKDGFKWFNMALENPAAASNIKDMAMDESKVCTNIFNVLCKYEGQADDEEILQALEDKYDSLRDKLLAEALMRLLGEKAWKEMSERERQQRLMKLKLEERRLRREGKYDELAKLLGDAMANEEKLQNLMGMSREEYEKKLRERLNKRKRGTGLETFEEEEVSEVGEGDPLSDLSDRYEQEKEALLRMLAGQGARYLSEQERQKELARLRRELRKAEREEKFGAAAMVLGLAERNAEMAKRLESDRKRQEELAKQRIAILKAKMKKGQLPEISISENDEKIVKDGNKTALMDAVLAKQEILFEAERTWLVHFLNSQSELKPDQTGLKHPDPVKLASVKSSSLMSEKLVDINSKLPNEVNVHQHRMQLIEASLFRQAILSQHLVSTSLKEAHSKENLDVKMLAVLQDTQDRKSQALTEMMSQLDKDKLVEMQETYLNWAKAGITENIPPTFFSISNENDAVEMALQGKYDAILTALVEKALSQKKGEKKWSSMTEHERERLIAEMKHEINKLIAAGKTAEACKLLGEFGKDTDAIIAMFGMDSDEQERSRLENERKARKNQRINEGMSEVDADRLLLEEEERDEERLKKRRRNVLDLLQYDLEAQRAAIMRRLADGDDKLSEEKRRQLELAKLRLLQRRMERENNVHAVAQIMALSKLSVDRLEDEKRRQLDLARKRLEAHRNGKRSPLSNSPLKLPDEDDMNALIEAIVRELEMKQTDERMTLMQLLTIDCASGKEIRKKSSQMDLSSMKKRIEELRELRHQWRDNDPDTLRDTVREQMEILKEATAINLEILLLGNDVTSEEEALAETLVKLQRQQMEESTHLMKDLTDKDTATLRTLAQVLWRARNDKWYDNVAESLLKSDLSQEEKEVVTALEEKYDLLKDKIIAEALMKQFGDKEWQKLSEQERQRKILEMKRKERKLREEGKHDEAVDLMASLIKSEEDIAKILGETRLSQQEELERRLERRRQLKDDRLAAGLAVDDTTLDAEMEKIDEDEKKKRRNVLLLLEQDLEKDRKAILARLRQQDEAISAERKRQLEIARLRREQKLIAKEDRFAAAAIIFNQAKKRDKQLAESGAVAKARQTALAKERIAAIKARKQEKEKALKLFDVEAVNEKMIALESEGLDGSLSSPERLLQEMDAKQSNERSELLLLLLAAEMDSSMRTQVGTLSDEKIKAEMKELTGKRVEWREKRFFDHVKGKDEEDGGRRDRIRHHRAETIAKQNRNMKRFIILKLEAERRKDLVSSTDFTAMKDNASVSWLTDIQTFQTSTSDVIQSLIAEKPDEILDMLAYGERKGRIESWNDSIAKILMDVLPPGQSMTIEPLPRQASTMSTGSTDARAIEETKRQLESLDQELEKQKEELEKRASDDDIDMEAALSRLQKENESKRIALMSDLDRQRNKVKERLRLRRENRDKLEYEAHAAAAMVITAEQILRDQEKQQHVEKSRQKSVLEQRLEERRRQRAEAKRQEEEEAASKQAHPLPLGLRLKREKTVFEHTMTESEKNTMLEQMQKTSESIQRRMVEDQERQADKVKKALAKKKENRQAKAVQMLREHTMVIEKRDLDLKRQKTLLEDRLVDIRTGKTKTLKQKGDQKVRDFEMLVNPESSQGMSQNEKMEQAAKNLQKKLMEQKEEMAGQTSSNPSDHLLSPRSIQDDEESSPNLSSRRSSMITDEDRVSIMKRRHSLKKKRLQEEEGRTKSVTDKD